MGEFGIMIKGTGPDDYSSGNLGDQAEAAILQLLGTLEGLGFEIGPGGAAIYAPHSDGTETAFDVTAPRQQVPVDQGDGAYKCPECGLEYANPGACTGGEYQHPAAALLPTEQVHAIADQAKADAEAEAAAASGAGAAQQASPEEGGVVKQLRPAADAAAATEEAAPAATAAEQTAAPEQPAAPSAEPAAQPAQQQQPADGSGETPAAPAGEQVTPSWPSQ